jgi:outer membrane protein
MKQIKKLLFTLILIAGVFTTQAQVAHINSEELVQAMPETISMAEEMKKLGGNFDTEYKTQASALQTKLQKYQEEAPNKTNEENEKRQQEVAEIQKKLQVYLSSAREELQKKEFGLLKPIIEKAQNAIQEVAKEKGIKYVMDSAPGKGLIVFEGEDLMASVKAKLGI